MANRRQFSLKNWLFELLLIAIPFILVTTAQSSFATNFKCIDVLAPKVTFDIYANDYVMANQVPITGGFVFPDHIVLADLNLTQADLASRFKGKSVVSVGEGVSGLLPLLLQNGVSARGLDLWYGSDNFPSNFSGKLMREYKEKYHDFLIPGDAQNMPFESGSVDVVLSHLLLNNIENIEIQKKILSEIIRVLKVSGEARIYGLDTDKRKEYQNFLRQTFGVALFSQFQIISPKYLFYNGSKSMSHDLLTIVKVR